MQLTQYKEKISALSDCLKKVQDISEELKMDNASNQINIVNTRLVEDVFHLVIVGEFSRGKSTFVNALLRKKLFPAFKNPTTAIISKVVYGKTPQFQIYYKDNPTPEHLTEENFKKLIASAEPDESDENSVKAFIKDQEFFASIDHAEISYPLEFCKNGVEIVDTPGTNDLNAGRIEITYGYLNRADAVVLLLSATQPLSMSESKFLRERILGNQINDIFFVISHKDDLDSVDEEQRVIDFVTQNLKKILPKSVNLQNRIFLVSGLGAVLYHMNLRGEKLTAKQELKLPLNFEETGFPIFEKSLGKFLAEEKGNVRLRRYGRETLTIVDTMTHDLSINIGVISHSADEIRSKVSNFEKIFNQSKKRAQIVTSNMQNSFDYFINTIDRKCRTASVNIIDSAQRAVDNISSDMSANEIKGLIERAVEDQKKDFIDEVVNEWQKVLADEHQKAQEGLEKIWSDIDIAYQKEFTLSNIDETTTALAIVVPEEERSFSALIKTNLSETYKNIFKNGLAIGERLENVLATVVGGIFYLGTSIYDMITGKNRQADRRNKIRAQIYEVYQQQSKETSKQLKEQFSKQTKEICASIQENVNERVDDMERQLKEILAEKESQEQNIAQQSAYLNKQLNELKNIGNKIIDLVS